MKTPLKDITQDMVEFFIDILYNGMKMDGNGHKHFRESGNRIHERCHILTHKGLFIRGQYPVGV